MRRIYPLLALVVLVPPLGACSSASATRVAVSGTDSACTPAKTDLSAGDVTFDFTNSASDVNEIYVLRPDASVVGEVENVSTGTQRALTVSLVAGDYNLVCKPGQKGDGFRTAIKVTGSGGDAPLVADKAISIIGKDYKFEIPDALTVKKGETIKFVFKNEGTVNHEMEIVDPNRQPIAEVASLVPKTEGAVTIAFEQAGIYVMRCILKTDNAKPHDSLGMTSQIIVAE